MPKSDDDSLQPSELGLSGTLHPKHLEAIGHIATNWATLEFSVDQLIWVLAQLNLKIGGCITSNIPNLARKIDSLISICKLYKAEATTIKKLNAFKNRCHSLSEKRNRVIHNVSFTAVTDDKEVLFHTITVTARGEPVFDIRPLTLDELKKIYMDILRARNQLDEIHGLLNKQFSSLP